MSTLVFTRFEVGRLRLPLGIFNRTYGAIL